MSEPKDLGGNPSYGPASPQPAINPDPFTGNTKNLLTYIQNARANQDIMLELTDHQAKHLKMKYEAAMEAGFNAEQALEICTKTWF